ncbi:MULTISPECIES: acyl-CoA dehydrogenase family protein [Nocardiaceae]|uniref:Alkylation response protein AidB-like acyl-CoA dehydrogenase n=1 Tax=Rhodococcoides corynebacterioides TaxID=53972 RepID=A0ABS2KMR2_9NOCA|nr:MULTISPECIES: acyl-CoA dehydrogenase family protein [Rhodococcus]MBM7413275.1 alkylation response protein AidB-like acyl-CoA dehydrogenase [Rhodococcus corynebacterioides]MBP1115738.1 alkylation response protein AidB-like acyl-CoA dehydrogenase [Rhodococcus sp. PvP016]
MQQVSMVFESEQEQLRDVVKDLVRVASPTSRVREVAEFETGHDAELWRRLARDVGVAGLVIPEHLGGSGVSFAEQAVVLESLGAGLAGSAFLSSAVIATHALLAADDEATSGPLLEALASGERLATLAYVEPTCSWHLDDVSMSARADGPTTYRLTGTKAFVLNGASADSLIVVARTDEGPTLFLLDETDRVARTPMTVLDATWPMDTVTFDGAAATRVGAAGAAADFLAPVLDIARTAVALDAVGGVQQCLDMSVEHARTREQFGRPIGSFQAVKHACADMLIHTETARSTAYDATAAAVRDLAALPVAAAAAKAASADSYRDVAAETVQVHGGIGFTWEHDAHLYFRRAQSSALFLGTADAHRALLADRLAF